MRICACISRVLSQHTFSTFPLLWISFSLIFKPATLVAFSLLLLCQQKRLELYLHRSLDVEEIKRGILSDVCSHQRNRGRSYCDFNFVSDTHMRRNHQKGYLLLQSYSNWSVYLVISTFCLRFRFSLIDWLHHFSEYCACLCIGLVLAEAMMRFVYVFYKSITFTRRKHLLGNLSSVRTKLILYR